MYNRGRQLRKLDRHILNLRFLITNAFTYILASTYESNDILQLHRKRMNFENNTCLFKHIGVGILPHNKSGDDVAQLFHDA